MLKGLLLCAAACAAPTTVMAGDRDLPIIPNLRALLAADGAARVLPGRSGVPARPATFLPIAYRGVEQGRFHTLPASSIPQLPAETSFSIAELRVRPSWHLAAGENGTQTTSARGGSWAVYDTLSDYRKPRFRRSVMSTMLVLRIDGKEESAPLSVGGGGVAAALWKAMPGD
ncbi:hypothetical protein [Sphingomonas sp. KR3-1]|uniref:hypothetical protein n=1 Tax=Sphingomonas sp. KR3-1 TaxID=3156611 RepID=UPI0032B565E3